MKTLKILCPTGAPAVAFYNYAKDSNFETNSVPKNIVSEMNQNSTKDIIVIDTVSGLKAINNGAPFKIASTITFGNFYIASTGNDDNNQFRVDIDLSPFAPLNRDFNWNIHAWMVDSKAGIGAFFREDEDGNPVGAPLGFLLAISGVSKYKGFNLVEALPQNKDFYMIFDEFVPPAGTKKLALGKDATEGTALFDLYMTLERDRVSRGLNAIKLICLANPDSLISPVILTMDIIDEIAHMQKRGEDTLLIPEKHLAIHRIKKNKDFIAKEGNQPIYRLMGETEWAAKSLQNEFVDADFSCIAKNNLRGYKGIVEVHYKRHKWYIWFNEDKGSYYMTSQKPPQACPDVIDMSQEKDRLRFLRD